jgi:hypothetical protein
MSKHRLSFTERRRANMAIKFERLEEMEKRAMITEPISVGALSLGLPLGIEAILGIAGTVRASAARAAAQPGQNIGAARRQDLPDAPHTKARSDAQFMS